MHVLRAALAGVHSPAPMRTGILDRVMHCTSLGKRQGHRIVAHGPCNSVPQRFAGRPKHTRPFNGSTVVAWQP